VPKDAVISQHDRKADEGPQRKWQDKNGKTEPWFHLLGTLACGSRGRKGACVCVCVCGWSVAVPWVIINRRRSWYGRATGALQSMVSQGALGHLPQPLHSMGEVGDGGVEEGLSWEYCGSATSLKPTWNLHKVLRQRMNTRTQSPSKGSSQSIAVNINTN